MRYAVERLVYQRRVGHVDMLEHTHTQAACDASRAPEMRGMREKNILFTFTLSTGELQTGSVWFGHAASRRAGSGRVLR